MKIRTVLMSAAVAAVLAASGTANAQLLGGGASGGLGGSVTGGLGNVGATAGGTLNGSVRGGTDALGRTRELGTRAAGRAQDTASSARGQVESAAAGTEATASGAVDAATGTAADATDAVSATANAAGEAGSSADAATDSLSGDAAGNVTGHGSSMLDGDSSDVAGNAAGNGSGMLDLGRQDAQAAKPIADEKPSAPRHERGSRHPEKPQAKAKQPQPQAKAEQSQPERPQPKVSGSGNANAAGGFMHGQAGFAQWYRNGAPASAPIPEQIILYDNMNGGYVNRWGANGEQWQGKLMQSAYDPVVYGGPGGTGCEACTPSATGMCYDPCIPWDGSTQACCAEIPTGNGYDGNPLFFPLDTAKEILTEPRTEGKVPSQYGWDGWPWETAVADQLGIGASIPTATAPFPSNKHNYSFTTEVLYWFKYDAATDATLDFTGDDDVWVFLNGKLAVDLGGWHVPLNGRLTINGSLTGA